ncbi:MAG: LPS export ABC transporter permease LptG [Blastochloris viridis]|uniref:LPS export ABC transporter permease LptG n=1 Tax=Blastochloris viridis TaxID=1079 RepID=A0A6N4R7C0_BLAVI|nr:MAG: LPS export ABC transporter permease LptG [Blastochloris viridis]
MPPKLTNLSVPAMPNLLAPAPRDASTRGYSPTLGWYLGGMWLTTVIFTIFGLGSFIYLIDVIDLWNQISDKGIGISVALIMSLAKTPDLLLQLLPFAVLIGSLVWLNQLNKRQELVALRAIGLPARRFLMGPLLACLLVGMLSIWVGNPVSAALLKRYEHWNATVFPGSTKGLVTAGGSIWLKQSEFPATATKQASGRDYFIYGRRVSPGGDDLGQATVFIFDEHNSFLARIDAEQAVLEPGINGEQGQWNLKNAVMLTPRQDIIRKPELTLPTSLTPDEIQASFNPPGTLNIFELREFISTLQESGFKTDRHAMAYQRLLALPFMCIAMLLVAVPFGLRFTRVRGLGMVIVAGVLMGFGFYFFGNFMATFGLAGRLDVRLAAWLPAIMASLLAMALMLQLREE